MGSWRRQLAATCVLLGVVPAGLVSLCASAQQQQPAVQAAAKPDDVFVGEPFAFEIAVIACKPTQRPDMSHVLDFSVKEGGVQRRGGGVTNIIINGRRMRQESPVSYAFVYELSAKRVGRLLVPAIDVVTEKGRLRTQAVQVNVKKPAETGDFKLRLHPAKSECYVGEPVPVTITWYISKDVRGFEFAVPELPDSDFHVIYPEPQIDPRQRDRYLAVRLGGREVVAEKTQGTLDGKSYLTVSFSKVLIPKTAGTFPLPQATVAAEVLTGYRQSRNRQPFGGSLFDDFFGAGRRGVYKRIMVPSDQPVLRVLELPEAGRPANFAGHVGEYRIEATAAPTEVNVGDPITLTIRLSGPPYLEHVSLPPLDAQESLVRDFKIPKEMAPGKQEGRSKVFTQTVRASRPGIECVPPIELPYFDTGARSYKVARTEPIPITVKETRVVTVADAEGAGPVTSAGRALKAWSRGIAHNYEDPSVLVDSRHGPGEWGRSPGWLCLLVLPPLVYLSLLAATVWVRRRTADPLAVRARSASTEFGRSLQQAGRTFASNPGEGYAVLLEGVRTYLGSRLRTPGGALTYGDVEPRLVEAGVDTECLKTLKDLFGRCEAGRYAGSAGQDGGTDSLLHDAGEVVKRLERQLR